MSSGRRRRTGRGRGGITKKSSLFGWVAQAWRDVGTAEPQALPDGRIEDLSVCPGAMIVKGTGWLERSLCISHLKMPLDMEGGRSYCPESWQGALPKARVRRHSAPARAQGAAGGWDGDLGRHHHSLSPAGHRHLQSAIYKGFQHVKVDTLSQPEAISSVAVPGRKVAAPWGGGHGPSGGQHCCHYW